MNKKVNLGILIALIIVFVSVTIYVINKDIFTPPTNIARFSQDTTQNLKVSGYQITEYDVNKDININNIWITYKFLENKNYKAKLKQYLDTGYNILVQGDNIDFISLYDTFNIPEENRASKPPVYKDEHKFYTRAILIFKHENFYYVNPIRFEHLDYPKDFYKITFSVFNIDKRSIVF